jgi:hypothetical protein
VTEAATTEAKAAEGMLELMAAQRSSCMASQSKGVHGPVAAQHSNVDLPTPNFDLDLPISSRIC